MNRYEIIGAVIVGIIIAVALPIATKKTNAYRFKAACEARGGHVIDASFSPLCVQETK